ncbi:MAG: hypothetical protein HY906_19695 [Deltaproteobacteria bacterium]|nr:hypothetical protein [Deltaproteobacteria bacterium]
MPAPRAPRPASPGPLAPCLLALAALLAACGATSVDDGDVDRNPRLVDGVSIRDIAVFQAVKVPIVQNGTPVVDRAVPLLVSRGGMMRVYVDLAGDWVGRELTAELVLASQATEPVVLTDVRTLAGPSSDSDPASVFAFPLADADMAGDTAYQVRITAPDAARVPEGQVHPARYPSDGTSAGFAPLFDDAGGLNLVLVPVRYDTDSSGRLPDMSTEQLARYDGILRTMYPLVTVNLTIHDPIPYNYPAGWAGFDFGALNDDLMDLRESENAPDDAYYFGLVMPDDTFDHYCGGGCVLGQSFLVSRVGDAFLRVGGGVGFPGEESAVTLAHEVGHQHGREHAPCDVPDPDPDYPYSNGSIGVWGYDLRANAFKDPATSKDYMSYCERVWTSDYTYIGIFDRVLAVNALPKSRVHGPAMLHAALTLGVAADGTLTPRRTVRLRDLPHTGRRPARLLRADGSLLRTIEAALAPHGHGGTGTLFIAEPPADAVFLEVTTWDTSALRRVRLR